MSLAAIRTALEKRLALMTPAMPTAYENANFTPQPGVAYQRADLLPNTPDNSSQGAAHYIERGIFQITLSYPSGAGAGAAMARAQAVRNQFRRGTTLQQSGVTVLVYRTPSIAPALIDGDRYGVPISVYWQADIFSA